MAECIHGLEIPLCDACYPKAQPEKPKAVRASRATPAAAAPARVAPVRSSRTSINAGAQRIYHVTHIRNLDVIAAAGALVSGATPTVDVSSTLTRELRKSAPVAAATSAVADSASVADYVPFYLAPDAVLWDDLRAGALDAKL